MRTTVSRREFMRHTFLLAGGCLAFSARARAATAPSNRIALGFIGTGSHGISMNLKSFLPQPDAEVVALCDVDRTRLDEAANLVSDEYAQQTRSGKRSKCLTTGDWREIVERDDIDAVVVSTPDHWHVIPSIAAAKAGKDVFCEKPLTLTVREGRVLSDTMQRYGRIFQTASENRSKANFLRAAELARNGRIGRVHTIQTWLPVDKHQLEQFNQLQSPQPVPRGFDYDMWLGQAPEAPYTPDRCHYHFRWIFDYSGGTLTDWGAHLNDVAQWANDTERTGPIAVEGRGVFPREGLFNTALEWEVRYEYANGVVLWCRNGQPGIRIDGADGWVACGWDTLEASSPELLKTVIGPNEIHLRTCAQREQRDFLDCVKTRLPTYAPAEIGHRTATICHIGNIAMLTGRRLRWNPDTETFADDETANRMLSRPMRAPWKLE